MNAIPLLHSIFLKTTKGVCTSGLPEDLQLTDEIAAQVIQERSKVAPIRSKQQYDDNHLWITKAGHHKLVVGSQARILYSDALGRIAIALAFNQAVKEGNLKGPIVLSRDHHDVSGTDSPYRETSNIYDGSSYCADMAIQNVIGDSFRGGNFKPLFFFHTEFFKILKLLGFQFIMEEELDGEKQ